MLRNRDRHPALRTTVCQAHATGIVIRPQEHSRPRENRVVHLPLCVGSIQCLAISVRLLVPSKTTSRNESLPINRLGITVVQTSGLLSSGSQVRPLPGAPPGNAVTFPIPILALPGGHFVVSNGPTNPVLDRATQCRLPHRNHRARYRRHLHQDGVAPHPRFARGTVGDCKANGVSICRGLSTTSPWTMPLRIPRCKCGSFKCEIGARIKRFNDRGDRCRVLTPSPV